MADSTGHIIWKDEYSVNVKEIDSQHKHFIGLLNKMYDEAVKPTSKSQLSKILDDLITYGVEHFNTEEKYFKKFKYPDTDEHVKVHEELKSKLVFYKGKHEAGEDIAFELLDFIEDWLVYHLAYYDQKYSKFFNENGLF